jgi:hypothetical protein
MGGVWFPTTTNLLERPRFGSADASSTQGPLLWTARLDPEIVKKLISFFNPRGTVTNSDLELAADLVQHDMAAQAFDIQERTISSGSDNKPTIAWQTKGSTTTTSAPAYLLRLQALHQRFHRYHSSAFFVPGKLAFLRDLRSAQTAAGAGIVSSRTNSNDKTWLLWLSFCQDLFVNPWLTDRCIDSILLLQVFAERYRTGQISPRRWPVKSRIVEGALRAMGRAFASMGSGDPRLTLTGKTEFRLSRQLRGYARADPPPDRVKPIPVAAIHHATQLACADGSVESLAVINMLCLAFFFLCRPGEYTAPTGDNAP